MKECEYKISSASLENIRDHLLLCEGVFNIPLSARVNVDSYAQKLFTKAITFEAWKNVELIGLVATYCNSPGMDSAFITNVSVEPRWQGNGIATQLMVNCLRHISEMGFKKIEMEVDLRNSRAIFLYSKIGFMVSKSSGNSQLMTKNLR